VSPRGELRSAASIAALAATALTIVACGSSSSVANPVAPAVKAGHDPITTGTKTHHPYPGTGKAEINDDNPGAAASSPATTSNVEKTKSGKTAREPDAADAGRAASPCMLVTRREAEAILGHPIGTPALAPLGPSCIYRMKGSKQAVTVAVQSTPFGPLKSHLRKVQHTQVDSRTAYCGMYGQTTTIVSLPRGRVLTITATCPVGFRFAAKALKRV
jgi:hypothetical protein